MGRDAIFPNGFVGFVHHCLERGISSNFVQMIFHVGLFSHEQASVV